MLLSYNKAAFIAFFYGISLVQQYQAAVNRCNIATTINNGEVLPSNNSNKSLLPSDNSVGNVLPSNDSRASLNVNTNKKPVVDDYFKDLIENLNYLKNNTKFEPQEMSDSRAFEMPTQLKASDIQTSKYYARLAGAAYCNDENLKAWSCSHCKEVPVQHVGTYFDKSTQTKAYLGIDKNKKAIILGFRGTSTLRNFIQDAKFFKDPIVFNNKEYKVHRGFKQCSDRLLPMYVNDLRSLLIKNKNYKLVVVGHSLGGAIGVLSSLMLRQRLGLNDNKLEVFTYGEPRVGDKEFARYLNQQRFTLTRAVNNNDIVPHLPPQIKLISNYYHHHHEVWVNGNKDVYCGDYYLEDPNCSASKWYTPSVNDHLYIWGIRLGGVC